MRRQRIAAAPSQPPRLKSLDKLDIKELTQLQRAFECYKTKKQEHERECNRAQVAFNRARLEKDAELDALRREKQALEVKKSQFIESIRHLQIGVLRSLLSGTTTTTYDGIRYNRKASGVIDQLYSIGSRLYEISGRLSFGLPFGPTTPSGMCQQL